MKKPLKFLRLPEVIDRTGLSKSSLYDLAAKGLFPKPVRIGGASRWPEHEVEATLREWLAGRDAETGRAA